MSIIRWRYRARLFATAGVVFVCAAAIAIWPARELHAPTAEGRLTPPTSDPDEARFDAPDAAARYFDLKRVPIAGSQDVRERYRLAIERVARFARYSSRSGRTVPRLAALVADAGVWTARGGAPIVITPGANASALLDSWTPLGPGNIGGRSRALLVHPRQPTLMFAAGVSGGVWRTDDGGGSWRPTGEGLSNIAVNALAWHPTLANVIYAGTGEGFFREEVRGTGLPLRGDGIFKTSDGGATWTPLASTRTSDFAWVNDLIVSPASEARVYAATRNGVWRSRDGGATWARILDPNVNGGCLDLEIRRDRAQQDVLFASCGTFAQATVYRFADANSGAAAAAVLRDTGMGRTSLAIARSNQNIIYALAATNEPGPGGTNLQGLHAVFRSTNGGAPGSWQARITKNDPIKTHRLLLSNPISALLEECGFSGDDSFSPMGWYANVIAVDPRNPDIVWAAGVDWFRSDDAGATWGIVSHWWAGEDIPQYAHADQHALVFHPAYDGAGNQTLFITNDGGLFRTDNARAASARGLYGPCNPYNSQVQWTPLNHGYGVTQFYFGQPLPDGDRVIGGTQDNGTILGSASSGFDNWQRVFGGDGGFVAIDPTNASVIYAETQWGQLIKSVDGGNSFASATNGLDPAHQDALGTGASSNYLFITPFVIDPSNHQRLWTGGEFIYRTEDGAGQWQGASAALLDSGKVSALAVSPTDPNRVVAGASNGWIYRTDRALTTDARVRWDAVKPRDGFVTSVTFAPTDARVVYATYGNFGGAHVLRSDDGGASWQSLDGTGTNADALPDVPVHMLIADPTDSARLYIATDLGVFVSVTGGGSWMAENTGFGPIVTESLSLLNTSSQRWLYAFTHGRGAWRVPLR